MKKYILSILVNTFVGVVLSILLLELCQSFISNIIITNIFDKMDFSNKTVKIMSLLLLSIACGRLIYKSRKNDIPDIKFVTGVLVITIVYTYFRIFPHNNWHFVSFYDNINYYDAIYLIFSATIITIVSTFTKFHHKIQEKIIKKINSTRYFETVFPEKDTPKVSANDISINTPQEDKFNFYSSVKVLLKRIIEGKDYYKERAMCIGLSASWGSGKTSYLNLLQYAIEKDKNSGYYKQAIIVKFNPWFSSNSNRMVQDFMITLSETLNEYNPNISSELIHYSKILSKAQLGWFSNLIDICFNTKEDAIEKQFAEISKCINLIRKPIIIFIDDIDRLQPEEIIRVLQLVRNTANFKNSIFIIPYDETYIKEAIKKLNISKKYLEKILTQPHYLPLVQQDKKNLIIADMIRTIIIADSEETEAINMFLNDTGIVFTIRAIKRLINQVLLSKSRLSSLGLDDIYLYDLLIIEYLHLEYNEIYEVIFNIGDSFINKETNSINKFESELIHDLTSESYYDKNIKPKIPNDKNKDLGYKILQLLFCRDENKDINYFRLKNIDIYETYFEKTTTHKFISKSHFNNVITRQPKELGKHLHEWIKLDNKKLILYLLGSIRLNNEDTCFNLLDGYLIFNINEHTTNSSEERLDMILIGYEYYLVCNDEEYKSFYKSTIVKYFQNYNIDDPVKLNKKFSLLTFNQTKIEKLTKQNLFIDIMWDEYYLFYLKQYISLNNESFHSLFIYIYNLNIINNYDKRKDALDKIKKYCEKDFESFIKAMNNLNTDEYEITLSPLFNNSQNNWLVQYKSFLEKHSNKYSQQDWYIDHLKIIENFNSTAK